MWTKTDSVCTISVVYGDYKSNPTSGLWKNYLHLTRCLSENTVTVRAGKNGPTFTSNKDTPVGVRCLSYYESIMKHFRKDHFPYFDKKITTSS